MASTDQRNVRDPRNQPDGVNDEDPHGREKNTGTNQPTRNAAGGTGDVDRARQPGRPSEGGSQAVNARPRSAQAPLP